MEKKKITPIKTKKLKTFQAKSLTSKAIKPKPSKSKSIKTASAKLKETKSTAVHSKIDNLKRARIIKNKLIVGSLELCDLPDLGISDLQIRVDTGAKTSSLHVNNITRFKKGGKPWVSFDIRPDVYQVGKVVNREAAIHDVRKIKSSNGVSEERYVIKTLFKIGGSSWPIEITLTDRSDMSNLMLLGRQGMRSRMLVDPAKTFLMSNTEQSI